MICYSKLRPFIFALPPEKAHRAAIRALQLGFAPRSHFTHPSLATNLAGLHLPNPVGLAAGFDKNAECFAGAFGCGLGFVEIGTVTPRPQPGNPTPRVFRLVEERALINRLGFNNEGVDAAVARLRKRTSIDEASRVAEGEPERSERGGALAGAIFTCPHAPKAQSNILGGNIGKNKDSADAIADYVTAMRALYPHVDYITANISSPNTPGLRDLQQAEELHTLIVALKNTRNEMIKPNEVVKPIFIKIAPDNDVATLEAIAQVALSEAVDGLIVSNTTISRDGISGQHAQETGGLSGTPLMARSTETLRSMYQLTRGEIPLIGVGGIASAEDAYAKIRAGASAVQLYTALVYEGFGLVERINRGLVALLARDGFACVADAVGKRIKT